MCQLCRGPSEPGHPCWSLIASSRSFQKARGSDCSMQIRLGKKTADPTGDSKRFFLFLLPTPRMSVHNIAGKRFATDLGINISLLGFLALYGSATRP